MAGIHELTFRVKQAARDAGFELCGVAPVREFEELAFFPQWIAKGHAGEMKYLEARDSSGRLKRESLQAAAPWAHSVIVCAINYNTAHPYSTQVDDSERGWISRYAWGREDYHDAVLRRLRQVEECLSEGVELSTYGPEAERATQQGAESEDAATGEPRAAVPTCSGQKHGNPRHGGRAGESALATGDDILRRVQGGLPAVALRTWCYVDTGPIVERVYAKYAGVGWIGKNTCLLNQQLGSWLFLGVILTSLELEADLPAPDRCGTCTRCLDACPTEAFLGPYQLDARKCISYLTIEKRGAIAPGLKEDMGRHVFGCDICQDVCPWNRKAPATAAPEFQPREGLVNPELQRIAEMKPEEFRAQFRGSPVRRTKLNGLRRNAIIAMGNSGNRKFVDVLRRLREDEDPVVAESAGWALQKLMGEESGLTGTEERGCPSLHRQTAKEWFIPWHKS